MVKQHEIDFLQMEVQEWKQRTAELAKALNISESNHKERGKALNKLWEKSKELRKEIATLQKFCGKLTYDISRLHLENRIIIPSAARQIGCENKQFLVRDIIRQLINESGYELEFKVLQMKSSTKPDLTITGKEIK